MKDKEFALGASYSNRYVVCGDLVDISRTETLSPQLCEFAAERVRLQIDLRKTAFVIIDMQNDFCAEGGMVAERGGDYRELRKPIAPINSVIAKLRNRAVPVVWVNWGNRPDKRNLAPAVLYSFNRTGQGGIGKSLRSRDSNILEKDSWSAAIVDQLNSESEDVFVDKYRVSGFWDTPLDSILRNLQISTLLFAGVNADQCVLGTLRDAACLGYDTVLLKDCIATTSPEYCMQATLYNAQVMGFLSSSEDLAAGMTD